MKTMPGEHRTPSDKQEQILAMTAEIKALKQGNNKGSNSSKNGNK